MRTRYILSSDRKLLLGNYTTASGEMYSMRSYTPLKHSMPEIVFVDDSDATTVGEWVQYRCE
jgi:hypothetical protein